MVGETVSYFAGRTVRVEPALWAMSDGALSLVAVTSPEAKVPAVVTVMVYWK